MACLYVLRVSAADLFGNEKIPAQNLEQPSRKGKGMTSLNPSSGSEYMKNSQ